MKKYFFTLALLLLSSHGAKAGYNANIEGVVTHVLTYTYNDHIYFRLNNRPSNHPECKTDYFAIDPSLPADRRSVVLARLLAAQATGEKINIGYDKLSTCPHERIRVYRVG